MKREPAAIRTAFVMDPERREVYVEGESDQSFLLFLLGGSKKDRVRVLTINFVQVPSGINGGERGRLVWFAAEMEHKVSAIRCFVDADFDRLLNRRFPTNTLMTDFR